MNYIIIYKIKYLKLLFMPVTLIQHKRFSFHINQKLMSIQ